MNNEYLNILLIIIGGLAFLSISDVLVGLVVRPVKNLHQLSIEAEEDERRSNSGRN